MVLIENVCDLPGLRELSKLIVEISTTLGGSNMSTDIKCILMSVASIVSLLVIIPEKLRESPILSELVIIESESGLTGEESKLSNVISTREIAEFGAEDFIITGEVPKAGIESKIVSPKTESIGSLDILL